MEHDVKIENLMVVIPHSGVVIPKEIPLDCLSEDFFSLVQNVDWYTNWLYDFRDFLGNRHLVFPYCSLVLEANRHPEILDDSVPLKDVRGRAVYAAGCEPAMKLRAALSSTYLKAFHDTIEDNIVQGAIFLFDGHSTVTARGVADNQIDLMNFQYSRLDEGPLYYSPEIYVETYASELRKRLPEVKVTVNSSEYYTIYGHVCAAHSVNEMGPVGSKAPALIQETNERLYKNPDRTPNLMAINRLRRAFAESIRETIRLVDSTGRRGNR
jgi:hypothetical protein